jgi:rhodanese-related sulfurtransferase
MNLFRKFTKAFLLLSLAHFIQSCIDPGRTTEPKKVVESMSQALAQKYPQIPIIEVHELAHSVPFILVDVRSLKEMKTSMINGAISLQEFETNKESYKNKLIIPYCTIGMRSGKYTEKLNKEGLNAKNLKGGVLSYAHAGFNFSQDGKETKNVHVYSEAWNLLPKSYKGIYE